MVVFSLSALIYTDNKVGGGGEEEADEYLAPTEPGEEASTIDDGILTTRRWAEPDKERASVYSSAEAPPPGAGGVHHYSHAFLLNDVRFDREEYVVFHLVVNGLKQTS